MIELRPCPFCGGRAALRHDSVGINETSFVQCTNFECAIKGKCYQVNARYSSDKKAAEAWNRRADHD